MRITQSALSQKQSSLADEREEIKTKKTDEDRHEEQVDLFQKMTESLRQLQNKTVDMAEGLTVANQSSTGMHALLGSLFGVWGGALDDVLKISDKTGEVVDKALNRAREALKIQEKERDEKQEQKEQARTDKLVEAGEEQTEKTIEAVETITDYVGKSTDQTLFRFGLSMQRIEDATVNAVEDVGSSVTSLAKEADHDRQSMLKQLRKMGGGAASKVAETVKRIPGVASLASMSVIPKVLTSEGMTAIVPALTKTVGFLGKVSPILSGVASVANVMAEGGSTEEAMVRGGSSTAGALVGSLAGSLAGPLGTAIGGAVGGYLGDALGKKLTENPDIRAAATKVKEHAIVIFNNIAEIASRYGTQALEKGKELFAFVSQKLSVVYTQVGGFLKETFDPLLQEMTVLWDNIKTSILQPLETVFLALLSKSQALAGGLWSLLKKAGVIFGKTLWNTITFLWGVFSLTVIPILKTLTQVFVSVFTGIIRGVNVLFSILTPIIGPLLLKVSQSLSDAFTWISDIVTQYVVPVLQTIGSLLLAATTKIRNVFLGLLTKVIPVFLKGALFIGKILGQIPVISAHLLGGVVKLLVGGLILIVRGLQAGFQTVVDIFWGLADYAKKIVLWVNRELSNGLSFFADQFRSLMSFIVDVTAPLRERFQKPIDIMFQAVEKLSDFADVVRARIENFALKIMFWRKQAESEKRLSLQEQAEEVRARITKLQKGGIKEREVEELKKLEAEYKQISEAIKAAQAVQVTQQKTETITPISPILSGNIATLSSGYVAGFTTASATTPYEMPSKDRVKTQGSIPVFSFDATSSQHQDDLQELFLEQGKTQTQTLKKIQEATEKTKESTERLEETELSSQEELILQRQQQEKQMQFFNNMTKGLSGEFASLMEGTSLIKDATLLNEFLGGATAEAVETVSNTLQEGSVTPSSLSGDLVGEINQTVTPSTPSKVPTPETVYPVHTVTASSDVEKMMQATIKQEGHYGSVNRDDAGKGVSLGKFQWHGERARDLLRQLYKANPEQFTDVMGSDMVNLIQSDSKQWHKKKGTQEKVTFNKKQASDFKKLMEDPQMRAEMDQLALKDYKNYISNAEKLGITDTKAQAFYADLVNQYGGGGAKKFFIAASQMKGGATIDNLLKASLVGDYDKRRRGVYDTIIASATNDNLVSTEGLAQTQTKFEAETQQPSTEAYDQIQRTTYLQQARKQEEFQKTVQEGYQKRTSGEGTLQNAKPTTANQARSKPFHLDHLGFVLINSGTI